MKRMYHISMDGPSVNMKFYDVFKDTCQDGILHSLIDIGVCSLHVSMVLLEQVLKLLAGN